MFPFDRIVRPIYKLKNKVHCLVFDLIASLIGKTLIIIATYPCIVLFKGIRDQKKVLETHNNTKHRRIEEHSLRLGWVPWVVEHNVSELWIFHF